MTSTKICLLLAVSSCAVTSCKTAADATNGAVRVVTVSKPIASAGATVISASCESNEQMMGGGYTLIVDNNKPAPQITANFPADRNTWEVDVFDGPQKPADNTREIILYTYCYTGSKQLGMHIVPIDGELSGPAGTAPNAYQIQANIAAKPNPDEVVTAGGFRTYPKDLSDPQTNLVLVGSYPQAASNSLPGNVVSGWINEFAVLKNQPPQKVTTYLMYSVGLQQRIVNKSSPGTIPTLVQGDIIKSTIPIGNLACSTNDLPVTSGFFCTGGGYQLQQSGVFPYVTNFFEDNVNAQNNRFFGWRFGGCTIPTGTYFPSSWNQYALQVQFK